VRAVRYAGRTVAVVLVVVLAAFTYPGAVLVSMIVRLTPPPTVSSQAPPGILPWLHVEHPQGGQPYIADDRHRMVLLHGAIPGSLIDFWSSTQPSLIEAPPFYPIDPAAYDGRCPDNSATMPVPPLCRQDLVDMAALGFNSIRLALSWSLLEQSRGSFNQMYIDRVAQVVDWARALGMYVIIDMHQNAYSRYVGRPDKPPLPGGAKVNLRYKTGAPGWATFTDGLPSEDYLQQREANPAVLEADTNFWYNRDGIQAEYIKAVAHLARRFKDDSAVAGYSVYNEPLEGWNLPPGFEDLLLFPFYRRVIDAITGVHDGMPCWTGFFMPAVCGYPDLGVRDQRHLIFLDTGLVREITDFPTHLGLPVSSYPNLVLGMHAYTHGYTIDALAGQTPDKNPGYPWGGYDQTYSLAEREARVINAALFVTEFGNDPKWDDWILPNELHEEEQHLTGFAFWTWKENDNPGWGVYDRPPGGTTPMQSSGPIRTNREVLLSRVYPRASADPKPIFHYDGVTGIFSLQARRRAGDAPTILYVPCHVTGAVQTSGDATQAIELNSDGSRIVTVSPSGGPFTVIVSAGVQPTNCP
jgi:hypothetical protein